MDEVEVTFTEGLNVISGETGAGISILIGSVLIALGAKVFIRISASAAYHNGIAVCQNLLLTYAENVIDYK